MSVTDLASAIAAGVIIGGGVLIALATLGTIAIDAFWLVVARLERRHAALTENQAAS